MTTVQLLPLIGQMGVQVCVNYFLYSFTDSLDDSIISTLLMYEGISFLGPQNYLS